MRHAIDEASGGGGGDARGGGRKRLGRRRAAAEISEDPRRQHRRRRRRKGSKDEEGRLRRRGGVSGGGGGPAADHVRRAIRDPACGAYDLLVGRGEAPVLCGARRSGGSAPPAKRAVAYALDRMEGGIAVVSAR